MRKALLIGGTGTISIAVTRLLAENKDWELTVLNRGIHGPALPEGVRLLQADIREEEAVREKIKGLRFDAVADFIAYKPEDVRRDLRLFAERTDQYIFISSASAYQKPPADYLIAESTPLINPYWKYSQNKIACEELLRAEYRANGFPVTIVRPSHTYGDKAIPVALHGARGSWQVIERMRQGKPVLVPGDGNSLWTLTHNTDFAEGFAGLLGNPHAIGQAVHITSDESQTWNRIYRTIAQALGVQVRLLHVSTDFLVACNPELEGGLMGDKSNTVVFDNSKLKRLVPGYCAKVRFDEGVRRTLDYILAHPEWQQADPEFDKWCDDIVAANAAGLAAFWQGRMGIFEQR